MSNRAFLCLQRQGVQQFRIREKEGEKTACYQVVNKLLTKSQSYTSQVCTINILKKVLTKAIWADKKWTGFWQNTLFVFQVKT